MMDIGILHKELFFFDRNRRRWCEHHLGKFALIQSDTSYGFYDTRETAYEKGCKRLGLIPFLIKEVRLVDEILCINKCCLPVVGNL